MYPEHLLLDRKKAGARGWVKNASVPCPSQAVPTGHWETAGVPAGWEVECHGETPPNAESFCFFFPLILSFFKKKMYLTDNRGRSNIKIYMEKAPHLSDLVLIKPDPAWGADSALVFFTAALPGFSCYFIALGLSETLLGANPTSCWPSYLRSFRLPNVKLFGFGLFLQS